MKLNSICSTWSNDRAFSFFQEWHAFTVKEVEGTITGEEALRYTYKLIFKQDLKEIREWGLFTDREGLMQMGRYHFQILWTLGSPFSSHRTYFQGAKKIIFTACLSGKLKLEFTSPDVISNSPKPFWQAELISQFFCYSNSSKSITGPSSNLKTEFTCQIAKSTSPGLVDTTFFACCIFDKTIRSQVKTLRGYLSWIKNIDSTIHSLMYC